MTTLKEYIFELKDRLMLPHGDYTTGFISDHNDSFHTNDMLKRDVRDAINKVITDARLFIRSISVGLVANQYEYGYPVRCLKIDRITHTNGTITNPVDYIGHSQFIDGFSTTQTSTIPKVWSILETKAEVHRFWDSNADDYTSTSSITSSSALNHIYDQYANFGVIESGEYPEVDDIIWIDDDNSYAGIDYFDMETVVTTVIASQTDITTSANTARVRTADSLSSVKEGHLAYNSTDDSWGFVTAVDTSVGIIYVDKWFNGTLGYPSLNDSVKIGIANHIYLKTLNAFTTRAFSGGTDNTPTAADTYRMQDKYETTPTIVFSPVPSGSDTAGSKSITIYYSSEPAAMVDDNDVSPVPDEWHDYILDWAFILAIKRQPDRLGEIEGLELAFKSKIAEIKRNASIEQLGEAHNIYENINPGSNNSGFNLYFSY